ncbi:MAG: hypothetical protein PQJ58_15115 [Spirochaetales bacterium]|nr:hypothetical protein [Spirochaetales bacterium]
MFCISCQNYIDDKCSIEKIYASGMLKTCPAFLSGEDVITANGANFQICEETITLPGPVGSPHIVVTPFRVPGGSGWKGKSMICFEGVGSIRTGDTESLPLGSVWNVWQDVRTVLIERNHPKLNELIPLVQRRIEFDYSVVTYSHVPDVEPAPSETSSEPVKQKKIVIPSFEGKDMLEVSAADNTCKEHGDQMDLFAV